MTQMRATTGAGDSTGHEGNALSAGAPALCRKIGIPTRNALNCKVLSEQVDTVKYHCSALASMPWVGSRILHFLDARRREPLAGHRRTERRCFYNRTAQRGSSRDYPDFLPFSTATTFAGIGLFVQGTVSSLVYSHRGGAESQIFFVPGKADGLSYGCKPPGVRRADV
jgi:hypothetical protein